MKLTLTTPILELPRHEVAKLTTALSRKLAVALAGFANKTSPDNVTVEDLLNYLPSRYEDRSNFLSLGKLEPDMEAAVELYVKVSGGFRVGKNRHPKQPPLFLFEISGADAARQQKPVVVKWFVSGRNAADIVNWYTDRFRQGTRFVAFGKWEWDDKRNTYALMVNKPDEIEILPSDAAPLKSMLVPAPDTPNCRMSPPAPPS